MQQKDIEFFQSIATQIILYVADAGIENERAEERAKVQREKMLKFWEERAADVARQTEVLKLNTELQNRQPWTAKEYEKMPFLKDVKYRYRPKDKIHEFSYRRDGFMKYFCSKHYDVAKEKARRFIFEIKQVLRAESTGAKGYTVDYVFNAWRKLKTAHMLDKSWRSYASVYKNHIQPTFGSRLIKNILPIDLQPFFDKLHSEKGKTCENAKIIFNGLFEYAISNRFCQSNPMPGVIIERHVRKPGKALNDQELQRFKVAMQNDSSRFGLAGLIILYSGIRGFELQSLTFDWEQGTFTVKNAKLKKSQKVNPANIYRTVPIFPALWMLRSRIEGEEWMIPPKTLADYFAAHFDECTVKDLRHTFTTRAREAGIENELVNLWTGHLPGSNQTANTYTHFSLEFQKKQAKKLKPY